MESETYQDEMAEYNPNLAADLIRDFSQVISDFLGLVRESQLHVEGGEEALARLLVEKLRSRALL